MNNKRLIIFLGSLNRGGAERVVSLISNYFSSRGWEIWIGLLIYNNVEYKLDGNIHIVDLTGVNGSRIRKLPGWIIGIRKLVKKIHPDAILSFAARINIITQIACAGLGINIIVSERNDPYRDGRSKVVDLLTKFLYPKAHAVVFQTKRAAGYFKKLNLKNSFIIPNPISVSCKAGDMQYGRIVSVGRIEPQKNQKMLITAFSKLCSDYPEANLSIYGRGYLEDELQTYAKKLNIEDKIVFHGNVSDIHEQIHNANIFVLSSDYEGLSNALLEAMMMGLPCISTNCAGADEYIINDENGILVNVGDEEGMYNAIKCLLDDTEKAKKLGVQSQITSSLFYKTTVLDRWFRVITSNLENN